MFEFIESQLEEWPLARENYQALGKTERRSMNIGDLTVGIQHNPARIISTAAKTDARTLSERPCFLCAKNRPPQQTGLDISPGWELLLNPFPIFPTHFTIVSTKHRPQEGLPLDMVGMAEKLPGCTVFFNGRMAGASCPDHMHCQAVKTQELPLMILIEKKHRRHGNDPDDCWRIADDKSLGLDVPFGFKSLLITPDLDGMATLSKVEEILGRQYINKGKINIFVWIDSEKNLRIVGVQRKAHRPSCYGNGPGKHIISPGCIDMAGVLIAPLKSDYDDLSEEEVREIYRECGV